MKKSFSSTDKYIASNELIEAVNASVVLEKPLLIKGLRYAFSLSFILRDYGRDGF